MHLLNFGTTIVTMKLQLLNRHESRVDKRYKGLYGSGGKNSCRWRLSAEHCEQDTGDRADDGGAVSAVYLE